MAITVRTTRTASEFEQFHELAIEYEKSLDPDLRHADFARARGIARTLYAEPTSVFVAAVDAKPAGCIVLCSRAGSAGLVKKMYVRPDFRNFGVARALMTAVIDHARLLTIGGKSVFYFCNYRSLRQL